MKKIALACCISVFLLNGLSAQDMKGIRLGIQTTPVWSWLRTDDKKLEGLGSNWGFKINVPIEYFFTDHYAIATGFGFAFNQGGFIQNGYNRGVLWPNSDLSSPNLDTMPSGAKLHYRANYFEVPLGFKALGGTGEDSRMKYYFEVPFTLGFTIKGTGDIRATNNSNTNDENIRKDLTGLAASLGVGAGVEYEFAAHAKAVAGLVYQRQLTDYTKDSGHVEVSPNVWEKENSKATFGSIALKLGIYF